MKLFLYAILVFGFTFCSSKVISFYVVDEGRISFETFSFYENKVKHIKPQLKSLDSLIEVAISNELVNKGYILKGNSDVYISFSITTGSSNTTNVDNQRFQNNRSFNNRNYFPYYSTTTTDYKEGVLLIELWSKDEKLLWQGSKPFKVKKSVDTQVLLVSYAQEITASFKPNL